MKKILLILFCSLSLLSAEDYGESIKISAPVKMQTLIGEMAVNNILNAYLGGEHKVSVADKGLLSVDIRNIGIDIQGKDSVVFGYDFSVGADFGVISSGAKKVPLQGTVSFRDEISIDEVQDAYVVTMRLNKTLDSIFALHGIDIQQVSEAIRKVFSVNGNPIELWRQKYSELIRASLQKVESGLDLAVKRRDVKLSIGEVKDHIAIDLELELESEKQYFWIEGSLDGMDLALASNKNFKTLYMDFVSMESFLIGYRNTCSVEPTISRAKLNLIAACKNDVEKLKAAVRFESVKLYFRVKAEHGGILSFSREIKRLDQNHE